MYKKFSQQKKGFTLIEILVALGIFAFVVTSTTAALLAIVDANSKAQALKLAIDNLNVAVENMSRSIRLGTNFECPLAVDCTVGTSMFKFTYQDGSIITYELINPPDLPDNPPTPAYITRIREYPSAYPDANKAGKRFTDILTADVEITNNRIFYMHGKAVGDRLQPRVMVVLQGIAAVGTPSETEFSVQTSISQRALDE